jgi:uridine kinase
MANRRPILQRQVHQDSSTLIQFSHPRQSVQVKLDDGRILEGPVGTPLETFAGHLVQPGEPPIVAALVDGNLRELSYPLTKDVEVQFLSNATSDGKRIYQRSLILLMLAAVRDLYPEAKITVDHAVTMYGLLCQVHERPPFTSAEVGQIQARMEEIVDQDEPIVKTKIPLDQAVAMFQERGYEDKVRLLKYRRRKYVILYSLLDERGYFYGYMVPSTGYLRYFDLVPHPLGFVLRAPRRSTPTQLPRERESPQLDLVFLQYGEWLRTLEVADVGQLNEAIESARIRKVILVSEALHEQQIVNIAHQIATRKDGVRLVLVSGPSSSGKTTFSKRLAIQLLARGLRPVPLEMDNYFVERSRTPRDEKGNYDFEHLDALDLSLLNDHLSALLDGQEVEVPRFDFPSGTRRTGDTLRIGPEQIIIAEGIHGMNPALLINVPQERTFRVYISALTQLNVDHHNRISTTDSRLLRRMVRDARDRGYPAEETIDRWESVRRGEKKWVFPFQENADAMFNSALVYEMAVLKPLVEPLLRLVEPGTLAHVESKRWLSFLQWFLPCTPDLVPDNSILREFVGGSILHDFTVSLGEVQQ